MFDTIERERVNQIAIVGDAFGKPMLKALDENPGRWDLASLFLVASSGVMFSEPVKQGLLKHHPGMMLVDAFSSSEAVGMGQSVSSGGRRRAHGHVPARREHDRHRPTTAGASSPARARSAGWPWAATSPSATTRTREDRRHLHRVRGPALLVPRRLRHGRGRRHRSRCSAAGRWSSTPAARRSSPRRSRRPSRPTRASATPWRWASPTTSSARSSPRSSRSAPAPTSTPPT